MTFIKNDTYSATIQSHTPFTARTIFLILVNHISIRDKTLNTTPTRQRSAIILGLFCLIAIFGRIIPHPSNMTPFLALLILGNQHLLRRHTLLFSLLALFLSDCLLALWQPHPLFGNWTFFTYSGWLMIAWLSQSIKQRSDFSLTWVGLASLGFWLWTNFGSWLCGALYPNTLSGLITCYALALPFLERGLIGDLVWFTVLYTALQRYQRRTPLTTIR